MFRIWIFAAIKNDKLKNITQLQQSKKNITFHIDGNLSEGQYIFSTTKTIYNKCTKLGLDLNINFTTKSKKALTQTNTQNVIIPHGQILLIEYNKKKNNYNLQLGQKKRTITTDLLIKKLPQLKDLIEKKQISYMVIIMFNDGKGINYPELQDLINTSQESDENNASEKQKQQDQTQLHQEENPKKLTIIDPHVVPGTIDARSISGDTPELIDEHQKTIGENSTEIQQISKQEDQTGIQPISQQEDKTGIQHKLPQEDKSLMQQDSSQEDLSDLDLSETDINELNDPDIIILDKCNEVDSIKENGGVDEPILDPHDPQNETSINRHLIDMNNPYEEEAIIAEDPSVHICPFCHTPMENECQCKHKKKKGTLDGIELNTTKEKTGDQIDPNIKPSTNVTNNQNRDLDDDGDSSTVAENQKSQKLLDPVNIYYQKSITAGLVIDSHKLQQKTQKEEIKKEDHTQQLLVELPPTNKEESKNEELKPPTAQDVKQPDEPINTGLGKFIPLYSEGGKKGVQHTVRDHVYCNQVSLDYFSNKINHARAKYKATLEKHAKNSSQSINQLMNEELVTDLSAYVKKNSTRIQGFMKDKKSANDTMIKQLKDINSAVLAVKKQIKSDANQACVGNTNLAQAIQHIYTIIPYEDKTLDKHVLQAYSNLDSLLWKNFHILKNDMKHNYQLMKDDVPSTNFDHFQGQHKLVAQNEINKIPPVKSNTKKQSAKRKK